MDEDDEEMPETVEAYRRVVISYDVSRRRHSVAVRVGEHVFGRKVKVRTRRGVKTYRYPGLISRRGAERMGQSVLILREKDAEDFHKFLTELRVPHSSRLVWSQF